MYLDSRHVMICEVSAKDKNAARIPGRVFIFLVERAFRVPGALLFFICHTRLLREHSPDVTRTCTPSFFPIRVPVRPVWATRAIRLAAAHGLVAKRQRAKLLFRMNGWARYARATFLDHAVQAFVNFAQLLNLFFAQTRKGI